MKCFGEEYIDDTNGLQKRMTVHGQQIRNLNL